MTATTDLDLDSNTPLQKFYAGQNVLITGGTGFLGKLLIEKLLRSCPEVCSIYIIIRPKKGQDAYNRLDTLFDDVIFSRMKKEVPKYRHKVTAIPGDCSLPGLGLTALDKEVIMREISIVFNVAATVRFDEKIKQAVAINVNSTKEIMELARRIHNLKVIIHVSTAYSNCIRGDINEKFYEPPITGDNAIKLVQSLDDKKLDAITQTLLGDFPNTYAFTKCIAEQVVQQYGKDLPTGIFRPAIVVSTHREPVTGWIDNVYGPTGALVGGGAGLIRTFHLDRACTAELVPADLTVNALIATAWDVANNKNEEAEPPIYNYTSTWNNHLTWGEYLDLAFKYGKKTPSIRSIWCYTVTTTTSLSLYYVLSLLLHILPALLMDTALLLTGKEIRMLKIYKKIHKFTKVVTYFSTQKWDFGNRNMTSLWHKLNSADQDVFHFSMYNFDWDDYMEKCVRGLRTYVFKDDPENIPMARKRMAKMVLLHKVLKYTILAVVLWALYISVVISMGSDIGFSTVSENMMTIR
ncbi:hypothetical protein TSAR_015220 [Trichomalopsis sarcophagae]|uniref:Fatty acyl-CoA reductase n=1 Tax=Trichomalopsis sarcophagae TaxID=543379 RepID=A0A232EXZ4_9HYME|nr:hypothetical protein TSAR_015220 [Trichomalopsis sarcophagae]